MKIKHCAWLKPHSIVDILFYIIDIDKLPFHCTVVQSKQKATLHRPLTLIFQ